jgi:hypothetical protein
LLCEERAEALRVLGRPYDELQRRANDLADDQERRDRTESAALARGLEPLPPDVVGQRLYAGVAWFPAKEYERALELWPKFANADESAPYAAYCAHSARMASEHLELVLRELRGRGAPRLALVPIAIDDYLPWCASHGRNPDEPDSRADFANELTQQEYVPSWPPRRNQPCWCGTGRKYKQCCRRVR